MKKIICILAVVIMLSCAAASADQHLEALCTVSGFPESIPVTLDLYEQAGNITAVSSVFPDHAVELSPDESCGLTQLFQTICSLQPMNVSGAEKEADLLFISFLEPLLSDPVPGMYAGALFDRASSVRYAEFPLSDMTGFFRTAAALTQQDPGRKNDLVSVLLASFDTGKSSGAAEDDSGIMISVRSFDNERYLTLQIIRQEDVIMTVSADRTAENGIRFLICYRENGSYYFRDICTGFEQDQYVIRTEFLRSTSSILYAPGRKTLYCARLAIENSREGHSLFRYDLNSDILSGPLTVSGSAKAYVDGRADLRAVVGIGGMKADVISLDMLLEPVYRPVSFDDKTIVRTGDAVESAGLTLAAVSNIAELAAQLLPTLPKDYQDMILRLLNP